MKLREDQSEISVRARETLHNWLSTRVVVVDGKVICVHCRGNANSVWKVVNEDNE